MKNPHVFLTLTILGGLATFAPAAPVPDLQTPALAFEEMAAWVGAKGTNDDVREGRQAAEWSDTVAVQRLRYRHAKLDASAHDTLTFWAHSDNANNARLAIVIISDDPATEKEDYYFYNFQVDWTGWKQHVVPYTAFQAKYAPVGFNKIDHIAFASSGYSCGEPKADTSIKLDDMRFTSSQTRTASATETAQSGSAAKVEWVPFDGAAVQRSLETDGRVLVYFRSDVRMCKDFEKAYLLSPEVGRLLGGTRLYFSDPALNALVAQQYRVTRVPTLMILNADGSQETLSVNSGTAPKEISDFLTRVPAKISGGSR